LEGEPLSFWDRIKPAARQVTATDVQLAPDGAGVALTWEDGTRTSATAQLLRQQCPCAACVDEWTHQRTLDPARVPSELRIQNLQPVGNYAITLHFTDGHGTGIYPWPLLRDITRPQG
jgi:DUF971 family protein